MTLKRKLKRKKQKLQKARDTYQGALRLSSSDEWFFVPRPTPEPPPPREMEPERDEQEVKIACELVLLFALMHRKRNNAWWGWCQEMAFSRPSGSYSEVFFWSMRTLGGTDDTLNDFREYLAWKWEEFESGRLRREGPRWA